MATYAWRLFLSRRGYGPGWPRIESRVSHGIIFMTRKIESSFVDFSSGELIGSLASASGKELLAVLPCII